MAETRAVAERVSMDSARWEAVKEIFAEALELEPQERAAYVQRACAQDTQLRAEVESLLQSHSADDDFIEKPAARQALGLGAELAAPQPPSWIGRRFGVYRLVEEIGRGGMSEVFKAVRDDDEYQKEVAVKILRRGYDTESLLKRFKVETQILATLDHPNIARLLDAGTTPEGLPYLVMDYIEGLAIDAYCSQHRCDVNERLSLFRQLCNALQYVHQNLMVHADIKAGNVLVTSTGAVKLLDFGIARLLNPTPTLRQLDPKLTGLLALTPEYASPEQIRGKPITTSSDVWSLGVLLYRLLTGVLPFRSRESLSYELSKQICETEPTTPNVAAELNENGETRGFWRRLHGDLDNIVLMALEKDPAQRYSSVEALHEDIRRHLEGFPVTARSAGYTYQVVKFIGRHKAFIAAAVALVLSLIGGIVGTTINARAAWDERARAERHFNEVRKLANTFMFDIHNAIENLPGATPARQMLVMNALQYLDALSAESGSEPTLLTELASAYEKVADLQGGYRAANLGDVVGAIKSYRKALDIRKAYADAHPLDRDVRRELIRNYGKLSDVLAQSGERTEAIDASRRALLLAEELASAQGATAADRRNLGNVFLGLGRQMAESNQIERGLMLMNQGTAIYETLLDADATDVLTKRNLAVAYGQLGQRLQESTKRQVEALQMQESALQIARELLVGDERNVRLQKIECYALIGMAAALVKLGKPQQALDKQLQAVAKFRALLDLDPQNEEARYDTAYALSEAGGTLAALGEAASSERHLYESVAILGRSSLLAEPGISNTKVLLAMNYFRLGQANVARASSPGASKRDRVRYCEEARLQFERSAPVLTAAASEENYRATAAGKTEQIQNELSACTVPSTTQGRSAIALKN